MKLEDQVCSLDFSKRLKELGVKQDSFYSWVQKGDLAFLQESDIAKENNDPDKKWYCAFTVAELGEMLPEKIAGGFFRLKLFKSGPNAAEIYYADAFSEKMVFPKESAIVGITEADTRAKMLIYLIGNGLLKP